MSKKRKKKKRQYVDPYDVLEGRVNVTSDELIRLIHRLNPTNRGLGAEKESEHYKIKSRLQSLLIRKFSDRLLVEQPDPGNPELLSLKLRYFDEDACHALLPDLDPDVRSRVRRNIDEALSPGGNETSEPFAADRNRQSSVRQTAPGPVHEYEKGAGAGKEEYSPKELIRQGRQALEEYDYDTCEDYFYRAFIMSRGDIETALAILDFYVDHLALYEKALELTDSLSTSAKKNEKVKVLLALAAVWLGDIDRALDFLGSVRHPRAFEVYLVSARHFVNQGNVDRAKELLAVLKSFEPNGLQPEIIQLENDIRELRLKCLKPLEQEILFAWQEGEREQAVKLAGELLVEWPQSNIARRICNEFTRQQQTERLNLILQRADEAHAKAEFMTEAELLKEAVELSKTDQGLRERFNRVQRAAKSQQDEVEITHTIQLWADGCKKESLLRFAAQPDKQRREIMKRKQDEHFSWLSLLISAQPSLKPEKMVEAVLILGESKEILQKSGNPQPVVSILEYHGKVLQFVPEAREILNRAREILKEHESARAKDRLKKAVDLAAVEDFQSANECIAEVNADHLDEADRKIFVDMNAKLKRLDSIRTLEENYTSETEQENHFSRRDIALKLAGLVEPDTDSALHWRQKAASHSAQIKKEWSFVTGNIELLPLCWSSAGLSGVAAKAHACLLPDGRHIVIVSAHERWVFLRTFCIQEQKFKEAIVFRAPKAMDHPHIQQAGNEIWLSGSKGHIIALTLEPPEILSWHDIDDFVEEGNLVYDVFVFPRAGYLWLNTRGPEITEDKICAVINIESYRVERQLKLKGQPIVIDTDRGHRIAVQDGVSRSIQILSEQGKTIDTFFPSANAVLTAAVLHPNGSDYIFIYFKIPEGLYLQEPAGGSGYEQEDEGDDEDFVLNMEKMPDREGRGKPFIIDGSHGGIWHSVYRAQYNGLIFIYFGKGDFRAPTYNLAAFIPGEHGFKKLYQVELPGNLNVTVDEFSQKAAAINRGKEGFQVVILGPDKPVFDDNTGDRFPDLAFPLFSPLALFNIPTGDMKASIMAFMLEIKFLSQGKSNDLMNIVNQPDVSDPNRIAALLYALDSTYCTDIAIQVRIGLHQQHPRHPRVLMELASVAALEWKWREVISLLERVSLASLDDGTARHICNLLGIALYNENNVTKAFEIWQKAADYKEGHYYFEPYSTYSAIASMKPKKRRKEIARKPVLRLLNLIEMVDAHLLNERWLEALSFMEMHNFLSSNDLQLLARFAEAYLHVGVVIGEPRWFCKFIALANYCQKHNNRNMSCNQVFPPYIETWSHQRLNDTASRAARWLDIQPETEQV